jgi:hypothetical protein
MATIAIAPPTMIAANGIKNGPNLKMCSIIHLSKANSRVWALGGFLVELTGIEPVASWLQTRRSPS